MPPSRQKQLIEEFLAQLPPLPFQCPRETRVVNAQHSLARDQRVRLAPSECMPSLTAAYLAPEASRIPARGRIADYKGWILTAEEHQRFGYAVHTAVNLSRLFGPGSATNYVLLGDPTLPAAQINCVRGTDKRPNAQLLLNKAELKWSHATVSGAAAGGAASASVSEVLDDRTAFVTNSLIAVRALKPLQAGQELWIDYGQQYWERMSLYCPRCLEYGADAEDQMLICEAPGCKRAWHQLCLNPRLMEVPEGPFYCDIHKDKFEK
jgi:hypothetical protein